MVNYRGFVIATTYAHVFTILIIPSMCRDVAWEWDHAMVVNLIVIQSVLANILIEILLEFVLIILMVQRYVFVPMLVELPRVIFITRK